MSIEELKDWIKSFKTKVGNFAIRNPVIANLISMFLGGLVISVFLQYPNASIASANIIIAIATCSATAIHYASTRNQRNDRVWDMNKSILLDLAYLLSEVIDEYGELIDCGYSNRQYRRKNTSMDVLSELDKKIDFTLNVYKPLIEENFAKELIQYKKLGRQLKSDMDDDILNEGEVYQ